MGTGAMGMGAGHCGAPVRMGPVVPRSHWGRGLGSQAGLALQDPVEGRPGCSDAWGRKGGLLARLT